MRFEDLILRDVIANRPLAANIPIGTLFFATDTLLTYRNNGTSWDSYSGSSGGGSSTTIVSNLIPDIDNDSESAIMMPPGGGSVISSAVALSTKGNPTNSTAQTVDIAAANEGTFLKRIGNALLFGNIPVIGIPGANWTEPVSANFSWVNQGSSTITDNTENCVLNGAAVSSANPNIVARVLTAPSTPYTIIAYMKALSISNPILGYGLCFRASSSGKLETVTMYSAYTALTPAIVVSQWTNPTTLSSDPVNVPMYDFINWFKIQDNGTNRIYSVSHDGANWIVLNTVGRTSFITANQIGFFSQTTNLSAPNLNSIVTLWNWTQLAS